MDNLSQLYQNDETSYLRPSRSKTKTKSSWFLTLNTKPRSKSWRPQSDCRNRRLVLRESDWHYFVMKLLAFLFLTFEVPLEIEPLLVQISAVLTPCCLGLRGEGLRAAQQTDLLGI